jgi:hypothetical protein
VKGIIVGREGSSPHGTEYAAQDLDRQRRTGRHLHVHWNDARNASLRIRSAEICAMRTSRGAWSFVARAVDPHAGAALSRGRL